MDALDLDMLCDAHIAIICVFTQDVQPIYHKAYSFFLLVSYIYIVYRVLIFIFVSLSYMVSLFQIRVIQVSFSIWLVVSLSYSCCFSFRIVSGQDFSHQPIHRTVLAILLPLPLAMSWVCMSMSSKRQTLYVRSMILVWTGGFSISISLLGGACVWFCTFILTTWNTILPCFWYGKVNSSVFICSSCHFLFTLNLTTTSLLGQYAGSKTCASNLCDARSIVW